MPAASHALSTQPAPFDPAAIERAHADLLRGVVQAPRGRAATVPEDDGLDLVWTTGENVEEWAVVLGP